jgi:ligand-binding sensor domain-containing protein
LQRDGFGKIWIGLQAGMYEAGGIVQYTPGTSDITQGKWSQVTQLPSGNDVRALAVDGNNSLWIATNDGLTLRKADGTLKVFKTSDGLPSNDIRDIAYHIETENLWIATSAGAARWSVPQVN